MIMRTEHPKPQFMRENWRCLNGDWQFEIDRGVSGKERGLYKPDAVLSKVINVPFCPESRLSGIGHTDFMNSVWYKRTVDISEEELSGRVIIHFGAVDFEAHLYVNGVHVGEHIGGYVSFSFDITDYLTEGTNVITLNALDDTRNPVIPSGKQSTEYNSYGCFYTRTTGIWQTVWLEFVPQNYIVRAKYDTDIESATLTISAELRGNGDLTAEAFYEGKPVGSAKVTSGGGTQILTIPLSEKHLWEVGNGRLYDLTLTYCEDKVTSYFGLRSVRLDGFKFLLNEKSVFQRLILDQGFYPDGIYTAPSEEDLIADIDRSLAMGFNGARLHEKIFEERFLYHCARKGYIVWGEYPDWSLHRAENLSNAILMTEWVEELERDYNHPAIIGWCPQNETERLIPGSKQAKNQRAFYRLTKAFDPSRPCIDASGYIHVESDIFDIHDYEQDPEKFKVSLDSLTNEGKNIDRHSRLHTYKKWQPIFVSEYGGTRWTEDQSGWGYGDGPKTYDECVERIKGLTDVIMDNERVMGLCYTQLTDVEQEQNGLYTYDRKPKFDPGTIHAIFSRKAAIED